MILKDYYKPTTNSYLNGNGTFPPYMTFTPASTYWIVAIKLKLARVGNPGNVSLGIRATSGSAGSKIPTGSDLGLSDTVDCSGITTTNSDASDIITFNFSTPFLVTQGTEYAIVEKITGSSAPWTISLISRTSSVAGYAGGNDGRDDGSGFTASSEDFYFEVYGNDKMTLGEYLGSGPSTTKLLLHLNGNSTDSSGNGFNLSEVGSGGTYIQGKFGKSFDQNGSNNYLKYSGSIGIDGGNITMNIWVKDVATSSGAGGHGFLCLGNTTSKTRYAITKDGASNLLFLRDGFGGGGTGGAVTVTYSSYVTTTKYTLLTLTYDGTNVKGYADGVYLGQAAASGNGNGYAGSETAVSVGRLQGWDGFTYDYGADAIYDEPTIENRAWSPEEVKKYYTQSRGFYATL